MLNTIRAVIKGGQIQLLEKIEIPEGTEVLVTPLLDESTFWLNASQVALENVWDNQEDDVYAELLA
ncbi:MAG: antitoxin family protein [Acidobacteria bacterium]|nr:antitoxin family protein [Acidobacteriota bacterium]MBI3422554.1 antitoxin family protein [Acidobacteriota bacterium]